MMWGWGYGSWWMGAMMLVVWAAVIALVWWGLRLASRSTPGITGALRVLEERYARGEIDDDEFQHGRDLLQSRGS